MIEPMVKVTVLAPQSLEEKVITALQEFGKVQLILKNRPEDSQGRASQLLLLRERLMAMMEVLGVKDSETADKEIDSLKESLISPLEDLIPEIDLSLRKFQDDLERLTQERETLKKKRDEFRFLLECIGSPMVSKIEGNDHSLWWLNRDKYSAIFHQVREVCSGTQGVIEGHLHSFTKEEQSLAEFSVPSICAPLVRRILQDLGASEWTPPEECRGADYPDSFLKIKEAVASAERRIQSLDEVFDRIRKSWGPKQKAFFILIGQKLEQLQVLERCERIGEALVVHGWLPQRLTEDLRQTLIQQFGDSVCVLDRVPEAKEYAAVPTLLRHNDFFKPFELFLRLVRPPSYGTTDPTVMIGLFFPVFSGCIVGDAGYGIIMLLLTLWLRKRSRDAVVRDGAFILMTVSVWSLLWGCAFGEFFGDFGHRVFHFAPLWVERSHVVLPVLLFTISLGLAHVLIGLLLGIVQGFRGHHKRHAVEKIGNVLVILSMVGALMTVRQYLPPGALPGSLAAAVVGVVLLMVGGGIGGLIESMSAFGNILSYVRIGAIGLSSAILAVAASKFIDVLGLSFLGIFMALSIHLLNFVLAFGESSLHSARLHYVEFMGKFYDGQGTAYKPFSYRRNS